MGSRREHLVRVVIIEHGDNDTVLKVPAFKNYRVYMKNDSPEYDDFEVAEHFLNFLSEIDLIQEPNYLDEIDFGEDKKFAEKYNLDIFSWEKMPDDLSIKQSVEKIDKNTGVDYSGLIMEIKYNYYHNFSEQKIHPSDLLLYSWISTKNGVDIVPFTLYTLYYKREIDKESVERFKDIDKNIEKNIQLFNGLNSHIKYTIRDFMYFSTYTKENNNINLPILCNHCHKPMNNIEKYPFFIFEDDGTMEKIKDFPKKDIPFTDIEKEVIHKDQKYYLTIDYGIKEHYSGFQMKAYHYNCLKVKE